MNKPYQKPRARFVRLSSEALLAASEFGASSHQGFGVENKFGSGASSHQNFGESCWGKGGASSEGFGEKTVGQ